MDPQLLSGKEKRALVSSASLGPQYLSTRLALAGTPPLEMARDRSATTVILPSVEHTTEKCILTRVSNMQDPTCSDSDKPDDLTNEFSSGERTSLDRGALNI